MSWIGYIVAFFAGAAFLELAWYERRRRKHGVADLNLPPEPEPENRCPGCGGSGVEKCRFCNGHGIVIVSTLPQPSNGKKGN
jgi:hypothetical protein